MQKAGFLTTRLILPSQTAYSNWESFFDIRVGITHISKRFPDVVYSLHRPCRVSISCIMPRIAKTMQNSFTKNDKGATKAAYIAPPINQSWACTATKSIRFIQSQQRIPNVNGYAISNIVKLNSVLVKSGCIRTPFLSSSAPVMQHL